MRDFFGVCYVNAKYLAFGALRVPKAQNINEEKTTMKGLIEKVHPSFILQEQT